MFKEKRRDLLGAIEREFDEVDLLLKEPENPTSGFKIDILSLMSVITEICLGEKLEVKCDQGKIKEFRWVD